MKAQVVSFHCVLKNKLGQVLGSTFNQDVITQVDDPNAPLRNLAMAMQNIRKGERRRICLSAAEAYGYYDPDKVQTRRRDEISDAQNLRLGDSIVVRSTEGNQVLYRITAMDLDTVTLDANHPLAGQDLVFEIEAVEARDATPSEILESSVPEETVATRETFH